MSGSVFYQNLAALRRTESRAGLACRILPEDSTYGVIDSMEEDRPNLLYAGSGPAVLFYDREPSKEVKDYLKQTLIDKTRFLVMLGLGLGYVSEEVLRDEIDALKLIIVEKDLSLPENGHALPRSGESFTGPPGQAGSGMQRTGPIH